MTNLSGATTAVFIISLSSALEVPVNVAWETKDGTAKAGTDYEAASGSVTFEAGDTQKQIQVVVYGRENGDTATRKFNILLYPPDNAILDQTLTEVEIQVADSEGVAVTSLVVATGPRGLKGDPGLSAYELAKLQGFTGTLSDWINSQNPAAAMLTKTLRIPDATIPEMPPLADLEGKILAISGGKPIGVLPESGSAADVLIELAKPTGAAKSSASSGRNVQQEIDISIANLRENWRRKLHDAGLYLVSGSFEEGATVTASTDAVWFMSAGQCYTWGSEPPKDIPEGSTPLSTGGVSELAWNVVSSEIPTKAPPVYISRSVEDLLLLGQAGLRKHFGAVGDGNSPSQDTKAIMDWWDCLMKLDYMRNPAKANEFGFMLRKGPLLFIETGEYVYEGPALSIGLSNPYVLNIRGESNLSTKIIIANNGYFVDSENNPVHSLLEELTFYGGLGALRYRNNASNPTSTHTFRNLRLSRYKECGLSANSIDMPYFRLEGVHFVGDPAYDTTGACVSGLSAGGHAVGCIFTDNKYALKLSTATRDLTTTGPATPFNVEKCDFYRSGARSDKESHDVWIVPGVSTNNAGRGITFSRNKFGSENLTANDTHVLIADQETVAEAQTAGRAGFNGDRQHSTGISTGFVSGMTFDNNNVNSVHSVNQIPFILSNTPNVGNNKFNDLYDNGMPKYIIQFHAGIPQSSVTNLTRSNLFNAAQCMALQEGVEPQLLSNLEDVFKLEDKHHYFSGHPQAGYYPVGPQKIDFTSLFSGPTSGITVANATKSSVNNSYGGVSEATEITMSSADGRAFVTIPNAVAGRKTWLDVEIKRGSSNSVRSVKVEILNIDGSVIWLRRIVLMDAVSRWQKVTLPFIPSVSGTFIVKFSSNSYDASLSTKFIVGNLNVYMNDSPVPTGHNSGLDMNWSRQHIVNGNYHEWYDASGNKRAKNGAPTSATDGVIISVNPTA